MANELGLRNVAFEVDDLQAAVDRLAADGYGLVGDIGQYEHLWRMAYVRGPRGHHRVFGAGDRLTRTGALVQQPGSVCEFAVLRSVHGWDLSHRRHQVE